MLVLNEDAADQIVSSVHFGIELGNKKGNKKLVVAIVQDEATNEVLMTAFMDKDALKKTLTTGVMHYYSRSRKKMWLKGETSGNIQKVSNIYIDCDSDALLCKIEQLKKGKKGVKFCLNCLKFDCKCQDRIEVVSGGVACHKKKRSCFFRKVTQNGVCEEE